MPQPKTHGVLHNCPVNVGLPEIMKGIQYFASDAKPPKPEYEAHRIEYTRLKKIFQKFYNLGTISWSQFNRIITTEIENNNTAAQLIMGPVFREFIGSPLQADGNYPQLDMKETSTTLLKPLGISLKEITLMEDPSHVEDHSHRIKHVAENPIGEVKAFNQPGHAHWDRAQDSRELVNDADSMPEKMHTVYNHFLALEVKPEDSKAHTEKGIKMLKEVVSILAENTDTLEVKPAKPVFHQNQFINELRTQLADVKGPRIETKDVAKVKKAEEGESDESFARRLQDAELRKYDEEVAKKSGPRR